MRAEYDILGLGAQDPGAIEAFDAFRGEHAVAVAAPWQIQLALDELLSNIVKYAYADRGTGVIDLTYEIVGGECRVSITDDGAPYDPMSAPAAASAAASASMAREVTQGRTVASKSRKCGVARCASYAPLSVYTS